MMSATITSASASPIVGRTTGRSKWIWVVGGLLLLGILAVLFWFNPTQYHFYPRCMLYAATGLQCPGCGGLRAVHALLHGQVTEAFRLNPLLFVLCPFLLYLVVREIAWRFLGKELAMPFRRPAWLWGLLFVIIAFSILRNLPFGPLAWLKG